MTDEKKCLCSECDKFCGEHQTNLHRLEEIEKLQGKMWQRIDEINDITRANRTVIGLVGAFLSLLLVTLILVTGKSYLNLNSYILEASKQEGERKVVTSQLVHWDEEGRERDKELAERVLALEQKAN